ncbi:MAG: hypothetical protein HY554_19275 [Elusimicrobia bacterium]|nr:hypothetical protein [Elusimicrobiota bacterium]
MNMLLLAVSLACAATPEKHGFTFVGPSVSGWVDLSPQIDDPSTQKLLPDWIPPEEIAAFASDIYQQGFFVAAVEPGTFQFTPKQLERELEQFRAELGKEGEVAIEESKIVTVGGVPSGRFLATQTQSGLTLRVLAYVIPGAKHAATLLYVAQSKDFDPLLPRFEASAQATLGATHHKYANLSREVKGGLATLGLALVFGWVKRWFRGKPAAA